MGYCDQVFISVAHTPEIGNEGEDFGRDPVDWGEPVLQEPNQAEDLESIQLEIVNLIHDTSQRPFTR